jgi:non-specific serine/threonine protein kinase
MLELVLRPQGRLLAEGRPSRECETRLAHASSQGIAPLLLCLGTETLDAELDLPWRWLRDWACRCLAALCQQGDATPVPDTAACEAHAAAVPPFPGTEHVTATWLQEVWQALAAEIAQRASAPPGGLADWLRAHHPAWQAVGRISFHLAENPTDRERPFAFLATYSEGLNAAGQPRHLPLARALQHLAGDPAALDRLLAPVRSATAHGPLLREWLESRRLFQPLALTAGEAWRLLRESEALRAAGIVVKLPDWWRAGRGPRPAIAVRLDLPPQTSLHAGALLRFHIERSLDGEPLSEAEWQRLLSAETGLVSLRGRWVEVDPERLREVLAHWQRVELAAGAGGLGFLEGMRLLAGQAPRLKQAEPPAGLSEWSRTEAGEALARALDLLRQPAAAEPPPGLRASLRPYQLEGLAWLLGMTRLGLGACLADDMGLGKTLQVLALLLARRSEVPSPALLVVPASLLGNWQAEAARFAPDLRFFIAHPAFQPRTEVERVLEDPAQLAGHDAVLTTYALLQRAEAWQQHPWSLVVLDEAQVIKNPASGVSRAVKRLAASARLALTGTPVENRPGDLWSLFDFLQPGLLGSQADFAALLQQCSRNPEGFAPLRRLVRPFLLRRLKTDKRLLPELPDKIVVKAWCGLTRRQASIYAKLVDQLARRLADPLLDPKERSGLVLGLLSQFKQVCNHPSHWNGDGAWQPEASGKFLRLGEIATALAEQHERLLVFTQFRETCDPLARFLAGRFGREGLVLHGGTPVRRRTELVEAFQRHDGPPFLVASVKAGGTGLNLTAASHVVHFDRWWNPAVENQATDRAHRLGQHRAVVVHTLICRGTLEERIDALLEDKGRLASDLVGTADGLEGLLTRMSREELLDWLRLDASLTDTE